MIATLSAPAPAFRKAVEAITRNIHEALGWDEKAPLLSENERQFYAATYGLDHEDELYGDNIAHWAAIHGDVETLKFIYERNPELLLKPNRDGYTIAHRAAYNGKINIIEYLNEIGAMKTLAFARTKTHAGIGDDTPYDVAVRAGQINVHSSDYEERGKLLATALLKAEDKEAPAAEPLPEWESFDV